MRAEYKPIWDSIATEYYSEDHRTSRNFDTIIHHHLPKILSFIRFDGIYLDLGGGKGNLALMVKKSHHGKLPRIVIGDISKRMMKINNGLDSSSYGIQFDAFNMPFKSDAFDGIVSIMGDSYALEEVFREILRVLKKKGLFCITLPSKPWGTEIRKFLGVECNETIFRTKEGIYRVPSFLYSPKELGRVLSDVGFQDVKVGEWGSESLIPEEELSSHVKIAARCAGMPSQDVPLVTFCIGLKGVRK